MVLPFIGAPVYCWKQQYLQLVVSACYIQGTGSGASGMGRTANEGLSWKTSTTEWEPVISDGMKALEILMDSFPVPRHILKLT